MRGRSAAVAPALAHLPPDLASYCARFPTVPEWFARLDPEDIVIDRAALHAACMADAEAGEQPWMGQAFPFVGPPEPDLDPAAS